MNSATRRWPVVALAMLALFSAATAGDHPATAAAMQTWQLSAGEQLQIVGTELRIKDAADHLLTRNPSLVRRPDAAGTCPADGFIGVEVTAEGFVLEQQNCSGWDAITETLHFTQGGPGRYVLTRLTLDYYDRRTPDADPRRLVGTPRQFGEQTLADVELNDLYQLVQ